MDSDDATVLGHLKNGIRLEVIETVDLSNERERHLYYDALDLVEQFESTRSLCA